MAELIENIRDNALDYTLKNVDDHLESIYKREKFEKHSPYVIPIQIRLDNSNKNKKRFYLYLPLKETLKQL